MKTFEFKSAICTTKEQSERLLKLGIKKETADMWHIAQIKDWKGNDIPKRYQKWWLSLDGIGVGVGFEQFERVPAWSLHRLLEIDNVGVIEFYNNDIPNIYDHMVNYIERRIKMGLINPEYLEEKK